MATPFGNRLTWAYKEAGLTQGALAAAVGLTQAAVSEACNKHHGSAFTVQFAKLCGVDPYWLATGEGDMVPERLSERALYLAREFDRQDAERQERLYAMFMQLLEFSANDPAPAEPSPSGGEPLPAAAPAAPAKHRLANQT